MRCESRIRRDADQGLAEVLAAKHLGEGGGDDLKSLADILAVTDLARSDPGCHLGQERVVPVRHILADGEVPHVHAASFGAAALLRSGVRPWSIAVMRNQPTNRHPRARVEQRQHRLKYDPAGIFEIDVDAVRAGSLQVLGKTG